MATTAKKSFDVRVKEASEREHVAMLADFAAEQKKAYAVGLLTNREIQKLEQIPNWSWEIDPVKDFEDLPFKEQAAIFEHNLWMEKQKLAYRAGKLSKNEILKLEAIENWSWDLDMDNLLRDM